MVRKVILTLTKLVEKQIRIDIKKVIREMGMTDCWIEHGIHYCCLLASFLVEQLLVENGCTKKIETNRIAMLRMSTIAKLINSKIIF